VEDGVATTLTPRLSFFVHDSRAPWNKDEQLSMKIISVIVISLIVCQPKTLPAQKPVPNGVWGGVGIQLTVTPRGAAVDYGCDSGVIDERLLTDSRGKFSARGAHVFGSGGPRQPGDQVPKSRQARYEGMRKGDTLQLTVLLPDLNRKLGEFKVRIGQRPTLERCG
jgi:hypothetical protein